ncbi:hypothetical protein [Leptolyngbya ohadii]|uniref:hypothetical protein n=1 Tax=Leptolyngbya ohadii TaxID=1962290 RepID=UPI000B59D48C|nr:hypothetical protein [Leptolyngbya ohadii]
MIDRLIQGSIGAAVGFIAAGVVTVSGLQVRNFNLLATITSITGSTAALAAGEASKAYRRAIRQQAITPAQLDRAIGAISERYALTPDQTSVLVALQELKGEINEPN